MQNDLNTSSGTPSTATGSKVFVPFCEELLAQAGPGLGDLVPFQREYICVRLLDGTLEMRAQTH